VQFGSLIKDCRQKHREHVARRARAAEEASTSASSSAAAAGGGGSGAGAAEAIPGDMKECYKNIMDRIEQSLKQLEKECEDLHHA